MYELKAKVENPELATVVLQVLGELRSAKIKHPFYPADNIKRASIMMEEAGEVVRAVNQLEMEDMDVLNELKTELIQTAAMCIRFMEALAIDESDIMEVDFEP